MLCLVAQLSPTLCDPMDCSPPGSFIHGDSPGRNTGVGCQSLLQGIFPTQGLNPGFLNYRQILHHLATGKPRNAEVYARRKYSKHSSISFKVNGEIPSFEKFFKKQILCRSLWHSPHWGGNWNGCNFLRIFPILGFQSLGKTPKSGKYDWGLVSHSVMSDFVTPWTVAHQAPQARILEWVASPFSRGSSQPRNQTWVSYSTGRFFII